MNVPLRALGWALRFFWIIAIAFAITAVHSATLIRVNFGEPTITFTQETFTATLRIIFDNQGYYTIANFNVTTRITDAENGQISKATTIIPQISPQQNATIYQNVTFNLNATTTLERYLFDDSNFTLHSLVHLNYANLIPFGFENNSTIHWGAPLFNFTADTPQYSPFNSTHTGVNIPISFQNHSPYFSVTGTIRAEIFNNGHQLIGEGVATIDVPPNHPYSGEIGALINVPTITSRGQIQIYIETTMFSYGPMVVNYG